jgi:hypothetical protein
MPGTKDEETVSPFTLKNAAGTFAGRSNDIFAGLEALEQKHLAHERSRTDTEEYANLKPDADDVVMDTRRGSGHSSRSSERDGGDWSERSRDRDRSRDDRTGDGAKTSNREFQAPQGRAPGRRGGRGGRGRGGRVPDHGNRPQNWKYYNLEDVDRSEMSERSNTQAALAFLDERRKLREEQQEEEKFDAGSAACSKGLFSFAKRSKGSSSSSSGGGDHADSKHAPSSSTVTSSAAEEGEEESGDGDDVRSKVTESAATSTNKESASEEDRSEKTETFDKGLSFKSRKGVKRSIRSRDDDDD